MKGITMKNLIKVVAFISIIFVDIAVAVETKVIATVDGREITNIDVFNELERTSLNMDFYYGPRSMKSVLERIIDPIIFEQYAKKNSIQPPRTQDIGKQQKILQRLVIEHFDPNFLVVTEQDIQEFLDYHKNRGTKPEKVGTTEWVGYRPITFQREGKASLNELEIIKQRINNSERFEDIVRDYNNQDGFNVPNYPHGMTINDIKNENITKQGLDALTPWSKLKGKAVIVNWSRMNYYAVWVIDEYVPGTRTTFENALNSSELRQEALKQVISHKFHKAKWAFLAKQMAENVVTASYSPQKLADEHEQWWAETHKNDPDFQERLKRLQDSKEKYLERERKLKKGNL
jgi:hypothetical protein